MTETNQKGLFKQVFPNNEIEIKIKLTPLSDELMNKILYVLSELQDIPINLDADELEKCIKSEYTDELTRDQVVYIKEYIEDEATYLLKNIISREGLSQEIKEGIIVETMTDYTYYRYKLYEDPEYAVGVDKIKLREKMVGDV